MLNQRLLEEFLSHLNVVFFENLPVKWLNVRQRFSKGFVPSFLLLRLGGHSREQEEDHLVKVATLICQLYRQVVELHHLVNLLAHPREGPVVAANVHVDFGVALFWLHQRSDPLPELSEHWLPQSISLDPAFRNAACFILLALHLQMW